jgi:hypothetical protein
MKTKKWMLAAIAASLVAVGSPAKAKAELVKIYLAVNQEVTTGTIWATGRRTMFNLQHGNFLGAAYSRFKITDPNSHYYACTRVNSWNGRTILQSSWQCSAAGSGSWIQAAVGFSGLISSEVWLVCTGNYCGPSAEHTHFIFSPFLNLVQ